MQVVQSLEGGVIEQISWFTKGATVQQGQPLMRINDTKFAAEFGEGRERRGAAARAWPGSKPESGG